MSFTFLELKIRNIFETKFVERLPLTLRRKYYNSYSWGKNKKRDIAILSDEKALNRRIAVMSLIELNEWDRAMEKFNNDKRK